jgi:hypothetical protein
MPETGDSDGRLCLLANVQVGHYSLNWIVVWFADHPFSSDLIHLVLDLASLSVRAFTKNSVCAFRAVADDRRLAVSYLSLVG